MICSYRVVLLFSLFLLFFCFVTSAYRLEWAWFHTPWAGQASSFVLARTVLDRVVVGSPIYQTDKGPSTLNWARETEEMEKWRMEPWADLEAAWSAEKTALEYDVRYSFWERA